MNSNFSIGDAVCVNLGVAGCIIGEISGVTFKSGLVNYNILIRPFNDEDGNQNITVELNDIRSYFIEEPTARFEKAIFPNGRNGKSEVGLKIALN